MERANVTRVVVKFVTFIITLFIFFFVIYGVKLNVFSNKTILINYISHFGIFAPLFFILLQIFQVIVPIIPGAASCLAGVLAFGAFKGFIYNYLGLVLGSIIVYYLARNYGLKIVKKIFSEDIVSKYLSYIKNNKFDKLFLFGIIVPGFPDDLLCYIAGLSNIEFKKFMLVILIGRPITLVFYSYLMELL